MNTSNEVKAVEPPPATRSFGGPDIFVDRIYQENDLVYRASAADLMADRSGNELATCSRNGRVVVNYGSRLSWESEIVHISFIGNNAQETAQVYSMDAGDVLPEEKGDELIAVDEDYSVNLISYDENRGNWESDVIWEDFDWLYEVDIGELVGSEDQAEIVVVGEYKRATMLSRDGPIWRPTTIATDSDILEACWISDVYTNRTGNEVLLGGGRGILFCSYLEEGIWVKDEMIALGSQISDLLMADIDPLIPGQEIYATTFLGDVHEVWLDNGKWTNKIIHSEGKVIYGLETGEFGNETILSIATWNNRVGIIWFEQGFQFQVVHQEEYLLMGTGIFDIDRAYEGNEILTLSYLGRVNMVYQDSKGAEIVLPTRSLRVGVGETARFPFFIESRGGYQGDVELGLLGSSAFVVVELIEHTVRTDTFSYLVVTGIDNEAPIHGFTLWARTPYGNVSMFIWPDVVFKGSGFNITELIIEEELPADGQIPASFELMISRELPIEMTFRTELIPRGLEVNGIDETFTVSESPYTVNGFISSQSWMTLRSYYFFLLIGGPKGMTRAIGVDISLTERTDPNFKIAFRAPFLNIPAGGNSTANLIMISEFGFNENVSLNQIKEVPGIIVDIPESDVIPPDEIEIMIEVSLDLSHDVTIGFKATSGIKERTAYLTIFLEPPEKELIIDFEELGYILEEVEDDHLEAKFTVQLIPSNGEIEDLNIRIIGLPHNYSLSIIPTSITRLFYPLNVTFIISGPKEEAPESISVNLTSSEDDSWEFDVLFHQEEIDDDPGEDIPGWLIFLIILAVIGIGILGSVTWSRTRGLNPEDSYVEPDERDHPIPRRHAAPERHHGSSSGHHRFDHRTR